MVSLQPTGRAVSRVSYQGRQFVSRCMCPRFASKSNPEAASTGELAAFPSTSPEKPSQHSNEPWLSFSRLFPPPMALHTKSMRSTHSMDTTEIVEMGAAPSHAKHELLEMAFPQTEGSGKREGPFHKSHCFPFLLLLSLFNILIDQYDAAPVAAPSLMP